LEKKINKLDKIKYFDFVASERRKWRGVGIDISLKMVEPANLTYAKVSP